jgi:hypothetical protein
MLLDVCTVHTLSCSRLSVRQIGSGTNSALAAKNCPSCRDVQCDYHIAGTSSLECCHKNSQPLGRRFAICSKEGHIQAVTMRCCTFR